MFGCGDESDVRVLKWEENEVCVQMEYGPIWVTLDRIIFYA
jgi:hypothetical protein